MIRRLYFFRGLNVDFCPAFITEEEIAILSAPPAQARRMPPEVRRVMGYDVFGPRLGFFGDMQHPDDLLGELRPLDWASASAKM